MNDGGFLERFSKVAHSLHITWDKDADPNLQGIKSHLEQQTLSAHQRFLNKVVPLCIANFPFISRPLQRTFIALIGSEIDNPEIVWSPDDDPTELLSRHRNETMTFIMSKIMEMSLAKREEVCEAFHHYLVYTHQHLPSSERHLMHNDQSSISVLCRDMALRCDGIEPELLTEVYSHARKNLFVYFDSFMSSSSLKLESGTALTAAILQSIYTIRGKLPDFVSLLNALPFLVRHVANRFAKQFEEENINPDLAASLDKLSKNFYPRAKETISIFDNLKKYNLIRKIPEKIAPLMFIDGKDLAGVEATVDGSLKDSILKFFLYDIETGHANGMMKAWEYAIEVALSSDPITSSTVVTLYEIIGEAISRDLFRIGDVAALFGINREALTEEVI